MHPRLFHFGSIVVPTYGALAALGLVSSILLAEWCAPRVRLSRQQVSTLCVATALGTLVLSRLLLVLESPRAFRAFPLLLLSLPTVTRFGLLLALLSAAAYIFTRRMPLLRTLDALAPPALLLAAFLHAGSFFAGTDLGTATHVPWTNLVRGDEGHHPVALYAAVLSTLAAAATLFVLLRTRRAGLSFGTGLAAAALARFIADGFRPTYLLPNWYLAGTVLRLDQVVEIALVAAGIACWMEPRRRIPTPPERETTHA